MAFCIKPRMFLIYCQPDGTEENENSGGSFTRSVMGPYPMLKVAIAIYYQMRRLKFGTLLRTVRNLCVE